MKTDCCFEYPSQNYLNSYMYILQTMITDMLHVIPNTHLSDTFIKQMLPHHLGAIEMSKNALQYATNPQVQNIAKHIITSQYKSMAQLKQAWADCIYFTNSDCNVLQYQIEFLKITSTMFYQMSYAKITNDINCNFMYEMIPHHKGAIEMCQNMLHYCVCTELKPILSDIIKSQDNDIEEMQTLLQAIC